jgi:hypothetical protein
MTRAAKTGVAMADAIIDSTHLMYQRNTARLFLDALICHLKKRAMEFGYKKAENEST